MLLLPFLLSFDDYDISERSVDFNLTLECGPTGGLRATSGPRPLVTKPAKLFFNVLLVPGSSFIFFARKDFRKESDSYLFRHKML
jgi:hypothetical protein